MGLEDILFFVSGLGVFMLGLNMMSVYMESKAGDGLRRLSNKIGDNVPAGIAVGALTTVVTQSSSATSVMVVGLVNAGILTLAQGTAVMLGASVGTTITPFLANIRILSAVLPALCCVGVFMTMLSASAKVKLLAGTLSSLGLIFAGLKIMSLAVEGLQSMSGIVDFFANERRPLILFALSLAVTTLIQSSAATIVILTSILGSMPQAEMSFYAMAAVVLGANIGTCITAIIGAVGTNVNGKRAAFVHLSFKVIGTAVFWIAVRIFPVANMFDTAIADPAMRVTAIHIAFNLFNALLTAPMIGLLVKLSCRLIYDKSMPVNERA